MKAGECTIRHSDREKTSKMEAVLWAIILVIPMPPIVWVLIAMLLGFNISITLSKAEIEEVQGRIKRDEES